MTPARSARDVLFSRTQQRLLGALFTGAVPHGLSYAELLRRTRGGAGAIHRELRRFLSAELLKESRVGGHRLIAPNPEHPLHDDLRAIARKLVGATAILRDTLSAFANTIERAYIFGSMAKGKEGAASDVDVLIVGRCDYGALLGALQHAEKTLGRHVSVHLYEPDEYRRLVKRDRFIRAVDAGARIWIFEPERGTAKVARGKS